LSNNFLYYHDNQNVSKQLIVICQSYNGFFSQRLQGFINQCSKDIN